MSAFQAGWAGADARCALVDVYAFEGSEADRPGDDRLGCIQQCCVLHLDQLAPAHSSNALHEDALPGHQLHSLDSLNNLQQPALCQPAWQGSMPRPSLQLWNRKSFSKSARCSSSLCDLMHMLTVTRLSISKAAASEHCRQTCSLWRTCIMHAYLRSEMQAPLAGQSECMLMLTSDR